MRLLLRILAAWFLIFAFAADASAETCSLELKRFNPDHPRPSDTVLQVVNAQTVFVQIGKDGEQTERSGPAAVFKQIVKKEPKYVSKHPFRGVVSFGSQSYAFALDLIPPPAKKSDKKEGDKNAKPKTEKKTTPERISYNRLYFDLNHNGDLTDDKPIDVRPQEGAQIWGTAFRFPRVDVVLDDAGARYDYSFLLTGQQYGARGDFSYLCLSFNSAAYREGRITLDGKNRHVVLVDSNSNGRFNDEMSISKKGRVSNGPVPVEPGDTLLVDPKVDNADALQDAMGGTRYVSKLANVDDRFYDVKISPAGDKLTLSPSSIPLGKVRNPNTNYRATIYGDLGFVDVRSENGAAVPVPAGQWTLLSYIINATEAKKPTKAEKKPGNEKKEADKKSDTAESLAEGLAALLGGSSEDAPVGRQSIVLAQATGECKPITVVQGETVLLPFGPPYKPVVTAEGYQPDEKEKTLSLGLKLIGSVGEICSGMSIKGRHPSKPKFTITDAKGKVVEQGTFEYG